MRHSISFVICSLVVAAPAMAQITFTSPTITTVRTTSHPNLASPIPGGDPTGTASLNGFTFVGDTNSSFDPLVLDANDTIVASRPFSVGPLPTQITIAVSGQYKLANGGGTIADPRTIVFAIARVKDAATGQIVFQATDARVQDGNGFAIFDIAPVNTGFILGASIDYQLEFFLQTRIIYTSISDPSTFPTHTATVEFGGVTSFTGFDVSITGVVVPSSGPLALLALSACTSIRRRRR